MPAKTTLEILLQTVSAFALDNLGEAAVEVSLRLIGGGAFLSAVPRCCSAPDPPQDGKAAEPEKPANELHDLIIDALCAADEPLKVSAIAHRCNRKYTSHFRETIRHMREAGDLKKNADGLYELADE